MLLWVKYTSYQTVAMRVSSEAVCQVNLRLSISLSFHGKAPYYLHELFKRLILSQRLSQQISLCVFSIPNFRRSTYWNAFFLSAIYFWHFLSVSVVSLGVFGTLKLQLFAYLLALESEPSQHRRVLLRVLPAVWAGSCHLGTLFIILNINVVTYCNYCHLMMIIQFAFGHCENFIRLFFLFSELLYFNLIHRFHFLTGLPSVTT